MKRETSIAFQTDKTPTQYRALAQLVNGYPFDVVSVYGDAPFQPSFAPLIVMAQELRRARIGPACVSPSRLSPIDMAGEVAFLDHLTSGRAYLGIARGAWLAKHGVVEVQPPITAIRECVEAVQNLLAKRGGYVGKAFQIDQQVRLPYPIFRERVPILIGTWGTKLAAVAGELADELKIGGSANPAMIPVMQNWIAEGEQQANRTVGSVGVVIGAVTVVDEESRAAKNMVKRELALYLPVIAALDVTIQVEPELMAQIAELVDSHETDKAAALISDDLLTKFAFAGTPDEVLAQAQACYAAGAARVEFGTPHGIKPETGIKLIGERILPELIKTFENL